MSPDISITVQRLIKAMSLSLIGNNERNERQKGGVEVFENFGKLRSVIVLSKSSFFQV